VPIVRCSSLQLFRPDRQNGYDVIDMPHEHNDKTDADGSTSTCRRTPAGNEPLVTRGRADRLYAVFVTFVEIYNNYIYDLFDVDGDDDELVNKYECDARSRVRHGRISSRTAQSKQLRDDARGRTYIRDVREIEVRSYGDTIELLNLALKRRRIAYTQLNAESSRSHSVLSVRLVQCARDTRVGVRVDATFAVRCRRRRRSRAKTSSS
jgi:kinesin family member 23